MIDPTDKLLSQALKLSVSQRARLAAELLASVDGEPDADAESAWAAEIERRARRVMKEGPRGEPATKVHARIEARLRAK